jgi:hypothetical protein
MSPCREIATGTVFIVSVTVKVRTNKNSFQAAMKARRPVEMRPGIVSGNKICQKTVSGDASLLGSFIEAYIASNPALDKDANFGTMTHASLEFARGAFATCSGEYNWYEHFQLLMRHPIIKAGVRRGWGAGTLGWASAFYRRSSDEQLNHSAMRNWLPDRSPLGIITGFPRIWPRAV